MPNGLNWALNCSILCQQTAANYTQNSFKSNSTKKKKKTKQRQTNKQTDKLTFLKITFSDNFIYSFLGVVLNSLGVVLTFLPAQRTEVNRI